MNLMRVVRYVLWKTPSTFKVLSKISADNVLISIFIIIIFFLREREKKKNFEFYVNSLPRNAIYFL